MAGWSRTAAAAGRRQPPGASWAGVSYRHAAYTALRRWQIPECGLGAWAVRYRVVRAASDWNGADSQRQVNSESTRSDPPAIWRCNCKQRLPSAGPKAAWRPRLLLRGLGGAFSGTSVGFCIRLEGGRHAALRHSACSTLLACHLLDERHLKSAVRCELLRIICTPGTGVLLLSMLGTAVFRVFLIDGNRGLRGWPAWQLSPAPRFALLGLLRFELWVLRRRHEERTGVDVWKRRNVGCMHPLTTLHTRIRRRSLDNPLATTVRRC